MEKTTIAAAEKEARLFLARVRTLKEKMRGDRFALYGCKESGAVRRASMDLTRALADLRRSKL